LREEALIILNQLEQEILKRNKIRDLAAAYVLYAEIHYLNRDFEQLEDYIDRAIEIAEPQGYYQIFLENTGQISNIIKHCKEHNRPFLNKVAHCLELMKQSGEPKPEVLVIKGDAQGEKLSKREEDILSLIGQGMSNSEIAKALYISINTTQWHISHIYSKLDVKSRTQAVVKAQELGIL
jgi:LuxR family transcriptional regulator, maltose regulon positive regulatory protein